MRQAREPQGEPRVGVGERGSKPFRGEPVGLGKQDVDADRRGTRRRDPIEEPRNEVARPRPLPEAAEAVLVDCDDDRRGGASRARGNLLIAVEPGVAHRAHHGHVFPQHGHEQQSQQNQAVANAAPPKQGSPPPRVPLGRVFRSGLPQRARRALAQSSISMPSYAAETRRGRPVREISS